MNLRNAVVAVFSPTGSTRRLAEDVAAGLACNTELLDITTVVPVSRTLGRRELLIAAVPVYGGRIPAAAAERLQKLRGEDAPALLLTVYGNREIDDALLELKLLTEAQGFRPMGAAAFVAEHSIVRSIAAGRPDDSDRAAVEAFARQAQKRLEAVGDPADEPPLAVRGNPAFRPYKGLPFHPHAGKACVKCGLCAKECPVSAISAEDPSHTDKAVCITCMRCVAVCPVKARSLSKLELSMAKTAIAAACRERKEPEFFF